jgi:hypothetical protein
MTQFETKTKPLTVDAVQFPYWEYSDKPLAFKETPDWLKKMAEGFLLRPVFLSEDYWYLRVGTKYGDVLIKPGDWIVHNGDGEVFTCTEQMFKKVFYQRQSQLEIQAGADRFLADSKLILAGLDRMKDEAREQGFAQAIALLKEGIADAESEAEEASTQGQHMDALALYESVYSYDAAVRYLEWRREQC